MLFVSCRSDFTGSLLSCLSIGLCACIAVQAAIAINYIPSTIRQMCQFQGGVLGSLHNKDFHDYQSSQDSVDYLFRSAFWGTQLMGLIVWAAVTLLMLLYMWHVSSLHHERVTSKRSSPKTDHGLPSLSL
jgi:uncharacterized membrane protein